MDKRAEVGRDALEVLIIGEDYRNYRVYRERNRQFRLRDLVSQTYSYQAFDSQGGEPFLYIPFFHISADD